MAAERLNRRPPRARGARPVLVVSLACVLIFSGCGGAPETITAPSPPDPSPALTSADVQTVVPRAAGAVDPPLVIAVTDRGGNILAVFRKPGAPATATGNFRATVDANELAVALARTASYFSNDQAPLSSRTVRFISGVHFPPGI